MAQEGTTTNPKVTKQIICQKSLIGVFSMPWLYLLEKLHKARGVPAHWQGAHLHGSGERGRYFGVLTVDKVKEEHNGYTDCKLAWF